MSSNQGEHLEMKYLLATCALLGAVFFGWPLLEEDVSNECAAFEALFFKEAFPPQEQPLVGLVAPLSNGAIVKARAQERWPGVPPQVACALTYWWRGPTFEEIRREAQQRAAAEQRTLERAQEAQKAMRAYSSPATPSTAQPGQQAAPSYKPGDRSDMDRLIKSTR
jgi:hypothetical protein